MLGMIALFFVLYVGRDILVPIIFSTIVAILLNPLVNYLTRKKVNRVIAIIIALLLGLIVTAGLVWFIVWQASRFSDSLPQLKDKFGVLTAQGIDWAANTLSISKEKITSWIASLQNQAGSNSSGMIGQTVTTVSGVFIFVILLPVYIFTILFYKPLLLEFIGKAFPNSAQKTVSEVLVETKSLIQSYLVGLLIEAAIVATLNSVGLLIIGVQYALLLGLISALLNLIPYIGIAIATALPMVMALATQSPQAALWVFILFIVVQFIDNQFIVPYIVASKVKINALASIVVVVLIAGYMWGISGMFLAIPLTAILKVIFDRIEPLKPYGMLLGDDMPGSGIKLLKLPKPALRKKAAKVLHTKPPEGKRPRG